MAWVADSTNTPPKRPCPESSACVASNTCAAGTITWVLLTASTFVGHVAFALLSIEGKLAVSFDT
eukprot:CAMPEP_0172722896 /NCGR_PEP_ID=MMETSP1074-20121228/82524_1 /TAXON_ID=2916 /ORGANISM="Ceratium fusus, Strain PA161109" /LENGTH=64 /DNA_ID=CAMNT_0013549001 /DNA_START=149 /DNA_END=343 /DNA_ORIENTATION=-